MPSPEVSYARPASPCGATATCSSRTHGAAGVSQFFPSLRASSNGASSRRKCSRERRRRELKKPSHATAHLRSADINGGVIFYRSNKGTKVEEVVAISLEACRKNRRGDVQDSRISTEKSRSHAVRESVLSVESVDYFRQPLAEKRASRLAISLPYLRFLL